MKTLLLDVKNERVKRLDIEDELKVFYDLLDCDLIDIAYRKIGGKWFDIVCDDEGLLKEDCKISAIAPLGDVMLVGNLLFLHHDDEGNFTELDDADIRHIEKYIHLIGTRKHPNPYPMVTQCEY